jgi:hypothetical protein
MNRYGSYAHLDVQQRQSDEPALRTAAATFLACKAGAAIGRFD